MHIEFCAKLNFLEGEYAITQNMLIMACHNHVMPTRKVSLGVVVATGSGAVITIPPTSSS